MFTALSQLLLESQPARKEEMVGGVLYRIPRQKKPFCSLHFLAGPSLLPSAVICNIVANVCYVCYCTSLR